MKAILAIVQIVLTLMAQIGAAPVEPPLSGNRDEIKTIYADRNFFYSAIRQAEEHNLDTGPSYTGTTGITVPHHLLARDIMAKTYLQISKNRYKTIILICPDHFNGGSTPFSTTLKSFETVFGTVGTDKNIVHSLLEAKGLVSESDLFVREHAVHAELPFIKHYFPDAEIVVLAVKIDATKEQLDAVFETLAQIIDADRTLIVQSTDFSHYLSGEEADLKDLQTVKTLMSENADEILDLHQPDNIDSRGSQYLQSRLQNEIFKSKLAFIKTANSDEYADGDVEKTTSYITQIYNR